MSAAKKRRRNLLRLPWQIGRLSVSWPHSGRGLHLTWPAARQPGDGPYHHRVHFVRIEVQ